MTSHVLAGFLPTLAPSSFAKGISSIKNIWNIPSCTSLCICTITRCSTWIGVTYDTMRVARCVWPSFYILVFTNTVILLQDSREQFEWRLLLGTRSSAWDLILFKAAPGKHRVVPLTYLAHLSPEACVRRRAVLSVMANPNCPDKESAERAVNEVWESCVSDTRPFDEVCLALCLPSSPIFTSISRYINSVSCTPDLIKYFTTHIPLESAVILCSSHNDNLPQPHDHCRCLNFFTTLTVRLVFASFLRSPICLTHYSSSVMKRWPHVPI